MSVAPAPRTPLRRLALVLLAASSVLACAEDAHEGEARRVSLLGRLRAAAAPLDALELGSVRAERLLEGGWHAPERGDDGTGRIWAEGTRSSLWLVAGPPADGVLWLRGAPASFLAEQRLAVELNGAALGEKELGAGMQWLAFPVRADQYRAGRNRLVLRAARSGRPVDHGAGADGRDLSIVYEWALLLPRGHEPRDAASELRALAEERAEQGPGWTARPGEFSSVWFSGDAAVALECDAVSDGGDRVTLELVERGSWELLHRWSWTGTGPWGGSLELAGHHSRGLALDVRVPGDAPGAVRIARCDLVTVPRPASVVLVVVDTLRADSVLDGAGSYDTPALDRLAEEAIVFPRAFSHAPMTLPSHTALFSSRLPSQAGVVNNWQKVPSDVPLLADWLARYDYDTRAVLSLGTLWNAQADTSVDRGFALYEHGPDDMAVAPLTGERLERVVGELDPARPFFLFAHFSDPHEPYNTRRGPAHRATVRLDGGEVASVPTSEMTVWKEELTLSPGENRLEVASDHPFLVKHFYCTGPKGRIEPRFVEGGKREKIRRLAAVLEHPGPEPAAYRLNLWLHDTPGPEERVRRYREEVAFVDRAIGRLLDDLRGRGLYEDALVVFTSDHGEALGERGTWGHVETLKDEMLHVPLIVKPPAGHPSWPVLRARADELVRHVDLVPTILDLAELPPLPRQVGRSLLAQAPAEGGGGAERLLIAETHRPEASRDKVCLRDERFKMIYVAADPERNAPESFEMYDVVEDPGELHDVFAERWDERPEWPELLRSLSRAYQAQRGDVEIAPEVRERLEAMGYGGAREPE